MKNFILSCDSVFLYAAFLSFTIMLFIDWLLGKEAEHINAWSTLLRTLHIKMDIPPSKALTKFGLLGAWGIILIANSVFGFISVQILRFVLRHCFPVVLVLGMAYTFK